MKHKIYCDISIHDYEHRGDELEANAIIRRFGLKRIGFQYHGDGNTAIVECEGEITKQQYQELLKVRHVYVINKIDFMELPTLKKMDIELWRKYCLELPKISQVSEVKRWQCPFSITVKLKENEPDFYNELITKVLELFNAEYLGGSHGSYDTTLYFVCDVLDVAHGISSEAIQPIRLQAKGLDFNLAEYYLFDSRYHNFNYYDTLKFFKRHPSLFE